MSDEPSLIALIDDRLASGRVELPVCDKVAMRVHREVREGRLDADGLCRILESDPTLVGEVMRMANSPFFRGLSEVSSLREATVRLGLKQIAAITLSIGQKRLYSSSKGPFKVRLVRLWQHAAAASRGARWIALNAGHRARAEEAFVCGLLHDVGKMSLLRIIEDVAREERVHLTNEVVDAVLQGMNAPHGAKLLEAWNMPEPFLSVVRRQSEPEPDRDDVLLCIVRLVDRACALEGISDCPDDSIVLETLPERDALGLSDLDLAELRLLLEDLRGGGSAKAA